MHSFLVVYLFVYTVIALTDVNKKCIEDNSEPFPNSILIGSWFRIYRFAYRGWFPPSCFCIEDRFSWPTNDIVLQYKDKYDEPGLPYSLDDSPVLKNDSYEQGMVTGNQRAKFYVLPPNSTARLTEGYVVTAYKPLTEKFLMTTACALRSNVRWLLSRDKNATVKEMEEIIKKTPEFEGLGGQRFCSIDKYCLALRALG